MAGEPRPRLPTWKRLQRRKSRFLAKQEWRRRDIEHKVSREVVNWAIEQQIGTLAIGEASVVIAVGSPHRGESFEACRYVIDRVKQEVPIWKKEVFTDGEEWVEGS